MEVSIKNELGTNSIEVFQMAKDKNKHRSINKITSLLSKFSKSINLFAKTEKCPHENVLSQSKISKDMPESVRVSPNDELEKNILNKNKRILIALGFILLLLLGLLLLSFIFSSTEKITNIKFRIKRFLQLSNEYDSFASKKENNYVDYFIDGKDYFNDLFEKLMNAKKSIYIIGFTIDPEVFLRRPVDEKIYIDMKKNNILTKNFEGNITRLMDILYLKSKQNVTIYIYAYYDWLICGSQHAEEVFHELNPNINFIKFPDNTETFKSLKWTTHDKTVIIDDIIGYTGGLDLAWGRYDNNKHPMFEEPNQDNIYEFPLADYTNPNKIFHKNYIKPSISRKNTNRVPWHDVQVRIIGPEIYDFLTHFRERWNFAIDSQKNKTSYFSSIKKVAYDFYEKDNIIDAIKSLFSPKPKKNKTKEMDDINKNKFLENEIYLKYKKLGYPFSDVTALRSVGEWNLGKNESSILNAYNKLIENSKDFILIENQFFITKSWTDEEEKNNDDKYYHAKIQNNIGYYIRKRIEKAYKNNEKFKVYIIINLIPEILGDIENSNLFQIIKKYQIKSIIKNNGLSLIEQLEKVMGDQWKNYICFLSLRTHGILNGVPKTDYIVIHSKVLIVDDTKAIVGSANLNERSLIANRDTEFSVLIEDQKVDKSIMNGDNKYEETKYVFELRKKLMAEYLGIDINDPILKDPLGDKLFNFMKSRAHNNTKIYHDLFACFPDDDFTTFNKIYEAQNLKKNESPEILLNKYNQVKDNIRGFIVEYQHYFLSEEKLPKNTNIFNYQLLIPELYCI